MRSEGLGYNGVPTDLIAGCRQDRRMKDHILMQDGYRSRKIGSFQRSREGSLCHTVTPTLWQRMKDHWVFNLSKANPVSSENLNNAMN